MSDTHDTPDVPPEPSPQVALRDTIIEALRSMGPERVLAEVGNATQQWLSLDYDLTASERPPAYPYVDGDFLILGPEIFTSMPGLPGHAEGVISWKGENYVIQPPSEGTGETGSVE